jgi:hypothetical protein
MNKMEEKDKPEFGAKILGIGLMYDKQVTKVVVDLYWEALKDLTISQVDVAMAIHVRDHESGRFMPKPADLRKHVCRPEKTSVIAWRQVEDTYCKFNYYNSVQFEDGTINAVIKDMGGWLHFCSLNLDEPWTQKEFERRYNAYKAQRIELHESLPGFHELNNRNNGYQEHIPETRWIAESGDVKLLPPSLPRELPPAEETVKLLAEKLSM